MLGSSCGNNLGVSKRQQKASVAGVKLARAEVAGGKVSREDRGCSEPGRLWEA